MEQKQMMEMLYGGIADSMTKCGFTVEKQQGESSPVYSRGDGSVIDFTGAKGRVRYVFSADRIHILFGENGANLSDDSEFKLESTHLFVLDEYNEKDVKSLAKEICESMEDTFIGKKADIAKMKKPQTVSKANAKSGLLSYDPITLASRLSASLFPELKADISQNIADYGEFLCEDFFINHANPLIMQIIRSNDSIRMKKLFNILGDIYEDGTNEVQSVIAVTILGEINNDPVIMQNIMPYLTDTMLEPVLAANKKLASSKSSRMRLANPPAYKPKKQKRPGLMSQLMGGGMPQQ